MSGFPSPLNNYECAVLFEPRAVKNIDTYSNRLEIALCSACSNNVYKALLCQCVSCTCKYVRVGARAFSISYKYISTLYIKFNLSVFSNNHIFGSGWNFLKRLKALGSY